MMNRIFATLNQKRNATPHIPTPFSHRHPVLPPPTFPPKSRSLFELRISRIPRRTRRSNQSRASPKTIPCTICMMTRVHAVSLVLFLWIVSSIVCMIPPRRTVCGITFLFLWGERHFRLFGAGMVGAGCVEVLNPTNKLCVEIGFVDGGWPAQDLRSVRRPGSEYSDHEPQ